MDNYTESRAARQEDRDLVNAAVSARKPLELNNAGELARTLDGPEYRGPYSSKCCYCWLNHPHTTAEHLAKPSAARCDETAHYRGC